MDTLAEVDANDFLSRVRCNHPGVRLQQVRHELLHDLEHQANQGGATFDVHRAWAINAIAFFMPVKAMFGFFFS